MRLTYGRDMPPIDWGSATSRVDPASDFLAGDEIFKTLIVGSWSLIADLLIYI